MASNSLPAIEKWENLNKFAINTTTPLSIPVNGCGRHGARVDFNVEKAKRGKTLWRFDGAEGRADWLNAHI